MAEHTRAQKIDVLARADWLRVEADAQAERLQPSNAQDLRRAEAMLRAYADLLERWETLKTGVDAIHAHWASFHSVAPSAVAQVQALITRLAPATPAGETT